MKGFTFGFLVALTALPYMAVGAVSRIIPGTDTATTPTVDADLRANTENGGNSVLKRSFISCSKNVS